MTPPHCDDRKGRENRMAKQVADWNVEARMDARLRAMEQTHDEATQNQTDGFALPRPEIGRRNPTRARSQKRAGTDVRFSVLS